ncbi:MAG TPA: carboxylesterase/lipase family protein [Bryobacteraceae bacterium]|nr:carboxylesterase/lipase family protein [Bryobacteraceae bacterium]
MGNQWMHETEEPCVLTRRSLLRRTALGAAGSAFLITGHAAEAPVATTALGKVRGYMDDGISAFKGIPYGDDTSKRRFMKAVPARPWTGVRDAVSWGPHAPQPPGRMVSSASGQANPASEDCLNLNVWTPALRDNGKRPVMVWFHGGGYNAGTANSVGSDGVRLCKRGNVVVVSVNHRLNAFGYLYLAQLGGEEFADSGNVGQLDLILSLQWVHDNIAEFGGDPTRVLIFGESGGGAKNACLMGMPGAKGLFHRACSSSGETVTASRPETATERARAVLKALDITPQRIREIKTIPMEKLIQASRASGYYGPVVDGGALPRHPFDPDAPKVSAHVPFLVGTNHDESRFLIGRGNPAMFDLTWDTLKVNLAKYSEKMGKLNLDDVIALYRRVYPDYSASDVFFGATTDSRDWRPAVVEIERRAALPKGSAPTYSYELDWGSPVNPKMKAHHALDLPFLFDNVKLSHTMTGDGPDAYWMAEQISEAYIAFAHTGNPNTPKLPHWPAYDLQHRATMAFNKVSKIIDDPRSEPRKLFSQVPYENPGT